MNSFMSKNWAGMIRPAALEVDTEGLKSNYGKFTAKPLERGYGLTLGNSLRRVLLSSLQGAGIVAVKVDGVDHEFGTINNIKEEVSEIILNLKEIRFKILDKEEIIYRANYSIQATIGIDLDNVVKFLFVLFSKSYIKKSYELHKRTSRSSCKSKRLCMV